MERQNPIVTFTSDFGHKDGYTGVVKGVILSICPGATIVDISHSLPPFDLSAAKWVIKNSFPFFPAATVHLVVVDPGVGGSRKNILIQSGSHFFVGPDNGIFTPVLETAQAAWELTEERFFAEAVSTTFHGRDIYGPAAAHLAAGTPPDRMGSPLDLSLLVRLDDPVYLSRDDEISGEVIYVDRFGNLISNIPAEVLPDGARCFLKDREIGPIGKTYASATKGDSVAFTGSHGNLEIGVCQGRADRKLGAGAGDPIRIECRRLAE